MHRLGSRSGLSLQFGTLEEQASLLDSRSGGALGLPERATTTFGGVSARFALGPQLALFGQGSVGLTDPGGAGHGLVTEMSDLLSSSFGAGLSAHELFRPGDRLTLGVAQPLRVEVGSARLDRPLGRTLDGRIARRRERIDLAPGGREVDLEAGYRLALGPRQEVSLNWLTRLEPGHRRDAGPAYAVALRLRTGF